MKKQTIYYVVFMAMWISLVFTSPAFAAKWYENYQEAERLIEREEWSAAIKLLKQAVEEEPEPGTRKRTYGVRFIAYYPYVLLGKAYLGAKDADNALKSCEKAQKYGETPKKEVAQCLEQAEQLAKEQQAATSAPAAPPPDERELVGVDDPHKPTPTPLPLGETYAVIIGVGEYLDENIPDLRLTVNDAQGLYDVLTDPEHGGVPENHVKLLLNEEVTPRNIKYAIGTWLKRLVKDEDTVIIYYAGHGAPEGVETYWVTHDANIDDLYSTALSNNEIFDMLNRLRSKRLITFLDSCYSAATVNRKVQTRDITEIPWKKFSGEGRVTISASDGKQLSLELDQYGHGVFTYYLLKGLRGEADRNFDGVVEVDEIWDFVKRQVTDTAQKFGNPQTPVFQGSVTAGIPLTRSARKTKQERLAELLEQGVIRQEQYDCAMTLINSGKSDPLIDGLMSGEISENLFGLTFKCNFRQ